MSGKKSLMTPKEWMAFYEQLFREREPVIAPPRSGGDGAPDICSLPLSRGTAASAMRREKGK